jgi:archaellin
MFDEVFLIIFLAIIAVAGVCNWVLIITSLFNQNNGEF